MSNSPPSIALIQQTIQAGRMPEAEDLCRDLLEVDPRHGFALSFLSFRALESGQIDVAVDLGQRAVAAHPGQVTMWQNLGIALEAAGQAARSVEAHIKGLALNPESAALHLYLGRSLAACDRHEDAALAINKGFKLDERMRQLFDDESAPQPMRALSFTANQLLQRFKFHGHRRAAQHAASEALPDRFERFLKAYDGLQALDFQDPLQQPNYQYYPDLEAHPWWDNARFDWVETLESKFPVILAELEQVLASNRGMQPYVDVVNADAPDGWHRLHDNLTWSAYHLLKGGEQVLENCEVCPQTAELLGQLPLATAKGHAPEAFFSVLQPGTHIPPHVGLANTKLAVHLPLIVPPDCAIRVGGEERCWEPGKVRIFDDSYVHEAWNRSQETRIVLITEVWNPELTASEASAVGAVIGWDTDFFAASDGFDAQLLRAAVS